MSSNKTKVNKKVSAKSGSRWIFIIIAWTIAIPGSISFITSSLLSNVNILVSFIILIFIILIGIIFDIIGVAVTAANEVPFHSMAAKKIKSAKTAIRLVRNADKVSNFCNDVIGDICGIVSGSMGAIIIAKITLHFNDSNVTIIEVLLGALIAAATVGGKALGKSFAMKNCNGIINKVAKVIYWFKKER